MSKDEKVKEIALKYAIPLVTANLCVDEIGGIDQDKLAVAVNAVTAVKNENILKKKQSDEDTIKTLKEKYAQARERRDAKSMVSIKSKVFALGGTV